MSIDGLPHLASPTHLTSPLPPPSPRHFHPPHLASPPTPPPVPRPPPSPPTRPAQSPDPPLPPAQVVQSAVCHVGVDLNTASTSLLMHIGGLNASRAAAIVAARPAGGFTSRASLRSIKGIGPKTFEQVAALNEPHDLMAFVCL